MNNWKKIFSVYIASGNTIGDPEYANRGKETISQLWRLIFVEYLFRIMTRRKLRKGERGGREMGEGVIVFELIR